MSIILFLVPVTPCDTTVILAESQRIGGHGEYLMLCGLCVPSLGRYGVPYKPAIVHIAYVLHKLHFFFNFPFFFRITRLAAKKICMQCKDSYR